MNIDCPGASIKIEGVENTIKYPIQIKIINGDLVLFYQLMAINCKQFGIDLSVSEGDLLITSYL